jgi:alpha-amylase/alpha-mannosidase (GH57 family)
MTALIIHGHFYQPPRENPRTGEIERQPSAAPFHDWNERVHAESYGPNAFARIGGDVAERVVNNYAHISFNFGPTLLSWIQQHQPRTYQGILEADRYSSARRGGHGNAIAQAYGHAILPLANSRDRLTHVIWGVEDFRFRFGREPESIWLPETACNDETLDLLIDQGMRFVILSPDQARRVRRIGDELWTDVTSLTIDTTKPYLFFHRDGSSRSIAVFFYHGPLARAIAFEKALASSRELVDRFIRVAQTGPLVTVATDGETYGHHFKFGDLCLAHALEVEAPQAGLRITNYGEYLDHHQPEHEVEIDNGPTGEGTAWSCAHGVGRWSRDCGCYTGGEPGWNQLWREPLRKALEFLHADAANNFENLGRDLFKDPWDARNSHIRLLLGEGYASEVFVTALARRWLSHKERQLALKLLEIQRNSLLMFTSCGWFFSDLGGIETVQVMRYAARVIELQKELGIETPRAKFLEMLAEARSNVIEKGNGAEIFLRLVVSDPLVPGSSLVA